MDFKDYCRERQHSPYCSRAEAFKLGQQSKQAQINRALELLRKPMQGTVADLLSDLEDILDDA